MNDHPEARELNSIKFELFIARLKKHHDDPADPLEKSRDFSSEAKLHGTNAGAGLLKIDCKTARELLTGALEGNPIFNADARSRYLKAFNAGERAGVARLKHKQVLSDAVKDAADANRETAKDLAAASPNATAEQVKGLLDLIQAQAAAKLTSRIRLSANNITGIVDQIEQALLKNHHLFRIYQRDGYIVTPTLISGKTRKGETTYTPGIEEPSEEALWEIIDNAATFEKFDARSKGWVVAAV